MSRRKHEYPVVFTKQQLSAPFGARPVFWWLLGGAALAFLAFRRKDVAAVTEAAVEKAIESGKAVIGTLRDITDKALVAKGLYAAIDAELPNLPRNSKLIMISQALTESGWNIGRAAREGNNWWNITAGPAWTGAVWVDVNGDKSYAKSDCTRLNRPMTFKDSSGRAYCKIDQKWRKYATLNEAVRDYWDFLGPNQNRGRYLVARTALAQGNVDLFVSELGKAGYYTAPVSEYSRLVKGIMTGLDKYLA